MDGNEHAPEVHPEIAAARRDPRLDHGRNAIIADWWAALAAAERARRLAEWGLDEVKKSLEREELSAGFKYADPNAPADIKRELSAARARAALAEAESLNQMAEMNAMTVVTLVGALDAMVEALGPSARELRLEMVADQMLTRAEADVHERGKGQVPLDRELRVRLLKALAEQLDERVPRGDKLSGVGAERWERVLKGAGLNAPPDRPIPEDMNEALTEVVALRHVIAHRASRVDERALREAPSLRYEEGGLVRLSRLDYRRYAAALRTYADEVHRRFMRPVGPVEVDLANWQHNIPLNT